MFEYPSRFFILFSSFYLNISLQCCFHRRARDQKHEENTLTAQTGKENNKLSVPTDCHWLGVVWCSVVGRLVVDTPIVTSRGEDAASEASIDRQINKASPLTNHYQLLSSVATRRNSGIKYRVDAHLGIALPWLFGLYAKGGTTRWGIWVGGFAGYLLRCALAWPGGIMNMRRQVGLGRDGKGRKEGERRTKKRRKKMRSWIRVNWDGGCVGRLYCSWWVSFGVIWSFWWVMGRFRVTQCLKGGNGTRVLSEAWKKLDLKALLCWVCVSSLEF